MSRATIFTVGADGALTAMRPAASRSEDEMQRLVATHPELICDDDGPLLLIRRELPIADREDGAGRWSLDHLFVTRAGVPVLVELKRAVDTRLRREVVGQMLDYAANATAYWQAGRVAERFAAAMADAGRDADLVLAEFLGPDADARQFWNQVDANFAAGRIKMLFVADTIPRELARIVEFLNEQMRADVRAVELSWFESRDGVTALTPRIIGETERGQVAKAARSALSPIGREQWIADRLGSIESGLADAGVAFVALVERSGGRAAVTSSQGSIITMFDGAAGALIPLRLSPDRRGMVQLCLSYLAARPAFAAETARRALYDRVAAITGPLSTTTLNGFPGFDARLLNEPAVAQALEGVLARLVGQDGSHG